MSTLLDAAVQAAYAAGQIIREGFGHTHTVTMKGVTNPVTEIDHAAEDAILEILRAAAPGYGLLCEESGAYAGTEAARWIVDPLDGTVNYAHHFPYFGVSIALERAGQLELGVVYNPLLDELFVAERGKGARLGHHLLHVSEVGELGSGLIATGFPYDVWETPGEFPELVRLVKRAQAIHINGAAVLDMAAVACGRLEAYWDTGLNPWDVAAGQLLVEEAGGIVSLHGGVPDRYDTQVMVASNRAIYGELARLVLPLAAP